MELKIREAERQFNDRLAKESRLDEVVGKLHQAGAKISEDTPNRDAVIRGVVGNPDLVIMEWDGKWRN